MTDEVTGAESTAADATGEAAGLTEAGADDQSFSEDDGAAAAEAMVNDYFTKPLFATDAPAEQKADVVTPTEAPATDAPAEVKTAPVLDAETQSQIDKYKRFERVLSHFEKEGFDSADALEAHMAKQNADAAKAAEEAKLAQSVETERQTHKDQLQAQIELGELTVEQATAIWHAAEPIRAERLKLETEKAEIARLQAASKEQSDAQAQAETVRLMKQTFLAAQTNYPELKAEGTEAMVMALANSGIADTAQASELIGKALREHGERAVAEYVAKQAKTAAVPPVAPPGGNAPRTPGAKPDANRSWSQILGIAN